ncbi:avidin family protein [Rhizobium tropici]|uniref:Avidin family protein n=1 Tax=Rhizobium tropici TaxID=398 RepID=A0A5B0WAG5_RHITR|nr:avidin/streptavidin family protein [Rhizobium tropici]KAA1183873.1 avidin family protein [Rhizobium tropici]
MTWTGTWRNQYGSTLTIIADQDGLIKGTFKTALQDSAFFGHELPATGVWFDDCINFAFGTAGDGPTSICSFTGMLREGKLQTVWHVVTSAKVGNSGQAEKLGWAHSVQTNVDTFERCT